MKNVSKIREDVKKNRSQLEPVSIVVGNLVDVNERGEPLVQFDQNPFPLAIPALSILNADQPIDPVDFPVKVTLMFDNGRLDQPIITGLVRSTLLLKDRSLDESKIATSQTTSLDTELHTQVDGKKITLSAKDEIILKCGKSSILLRRDGKIVIKGADLISRSSSSNKIKGASVNIN